MNKGGIDTMTCNRQGRLQKHLRTAGLFVGVFDPILGFVGFLPPIFTSPTHHVVVRSCFEFLPFGTNVLCSKIEIGVEIELTLA